MAKDAAYRQAKREIEEARRSGATKLDLSQNLNVKDPEKLSELLDSLWELAALQSLNLSGNQLTELPEAIGQLTALHEVILNNNQFAELPKGLRNLAKLKNLYAYANSFTSIPSWIDELTLLEDVTFQSNQLTELPDSFANLGNLRELRLGGNPLNGVPQCIRQLQQLVELDLSRNQKLTSLPAWMGELKRLQILTSYHNQLTDLPPSLAQLEHLKELNLKDNPLNPELAAAYEQGLDAVMAYLRAKAKGGEIVLNEAKLILVGEGGVGKTSLLASLRGEPFVEDRPTTHGVEVDIKSLIVQGPDNGAKITLNGWDFGGQNIYRHTHQLFFTAPGGLSGGLGTAPRARAVLRGGMGQDDQTPRL